MGEKTKAEKIGGETVRQPIVTARAGGGGKEVKFLLQSQVGEMYLGGRIRTKVKCIACAVCVATAKKTVLMQHCTLQFKKVEEILVPVSVYFSCAQKEPVVHEDRVV